MFDCSQKTFPPICVCPTVIPESCSHTRGQQQNLNSKIKCFLNSHSSFLSVKILKDQTWARRETLRLIRYLQTAFLCCTGDNSLWRLKEVLSHSAVFLLSGLSFGDSASWRCRALSSWYPWFMRLVTNWNMVWIRNNKHYTHPHMLTLEVWSFCHQVLAVPSFSVCNLIHPFHKLIALWDKGLWESPCWWKHILCL